MWHYSFRLFAQCILAGLLFALWFVTFLMAVTTEDTWSVRDHAVAGVIAVALGAATAATATAAFVREAEERRQRGGRTEPVRHRGRIVGISTIAVTVVVALLVIVRVVHFHRAADDDRVSLGGHRQSATVATGW